MGWTLRAQLTRSATRVSANSTESTAASLVSLPCAMSKLFERLVLLLHDSISERLEALGVSSALRKVEKRTRETTGLRIQLGTRCQVLLPRVIRIGCRALRPQLTVTLSLQRVLPLSWRQPRPACVEAREHKCPT